jgi:integrase
MVGKRAKILSPDHVEDLLVFAAQTRHPIRNQVLVVLSVKAGLRAGEIANLTWPMVIEPTGEIGRCLELQSRIAKKGSGRVIPVHPELHTALLELAALTSLLSGPVIRSERGGPMTPVSIVCWFAKAYRANS